MKESELSEEFRNRSNCWADTEEAVQAMDEPTAIQFAKDYAEGCKKNDPFYTPRVQLHMRITGLMAEIAALKADKERMRGQIENLISSEADYSKTDDAVFSIKHLKSLLSPADAPLPECSCSHTYDGRLAKQCEACRNKSFAPADGGEQWIGDMSNESFDKWLRILKKNGEITVREDGAIPMKIQQVGGCYESRLFGSYDLTDVIDWVSTRGGLEFLSPADGDGVEETKDENGLLPCPFCGEKADFLTFEQQSFKGFEIRCSNQSCNAYKQTAPLNYWPMAQLDRQKAKWNSRAGRGIEG